jgi:hypothetical protein
MATTTILQLPQIVGGATGLEQLEVAQPTTLPNGQPGWVSIRLSSAQIAALASQIAATGPTGVIYDSPAAGAHNDYTVNNQMGPTVGFIELTPTANCNITGLKAGLDGQLVVITNLAAGFSATLNALNAGSQAANQLRMVQDFALIQNDSKSFKYSITIGKWIAIEF